MRRAAWLIACGLLNACSSQIVAIPSDPPAGDTSLKIQWKDGKAVLEKVGYGYFNSKNLNTRYRLDEETLEREFSPSLDAMGEILAAGLPELPHSYMALLRDDSGPVGNLTFDANSSDFHREVSHPGQVAFIDGYPDPAKDLDAQRLIKDFGPALAALKETEKGQRSYLILLPSPDGADSKVIYTSRGSETVLDHTGESITLDGLPHEAEAKLADKDFAPSREATKEILDAGLPELPHSYTALLESGTEPVGEVEILEGNAQGVVLNEPGQAVIIDGYSSKIFALKPSRFEQDFSEANQAMPPPPVTLTVYFESGSARLSAKGRAIIPQILEEIRKRPAADITVAGFTDTVDGVAINKRLSQRRSAVVASLLKKSGVPYQDLSIDAFGKNETMLAVPTPDNTPQKLNRRVEVSIR